MDCVGRPSALKTDVRDSQTGRPTHLDAYRTEREVRDSWSADPFRTHRTVSALPEELRHSLGSTYRIDRELTRGGMSRVFVVNEIALDRQIVLKVLAPELAHALSAERFSREIRLAARLQHPHIVPLLAAGEAGELLYYTMPLVEGESLRARIDRSGELSIAEATRLFREIADALAYAHRERIVHRDIKPDNVLLSHQHAMVTDFGVARAVSEAGDKTALTQSGIAVGTPAYMAPEQAAGDSHTDQRADIYAVGLVAYEMVAGHPPFQGATPQALIAAHMTQAPPSLVSVRSTVPAELATIVHRCLEKRPADRFQDATDLLAALDGIAGTLARGIATPAGTSAFSTDPTTTNPSRRKFLATAAALGLVSAGFGGGYSLSSRRTIRVAPSFHRLTFRRGMIRTARFGQDPQTVLYGALWDGDVARVYTVRAEDSETSALAIPPAVPLAVSPSSGEIALGMGNHFRGIMTYGTLARVPMVGGAPRELMEDVKYADWSASGNELAVIRRVGDQDKIEFPIGTVIAEPSTPTGGYSFVRVSPNGDAVAAFALIDRDWLSGRVVVIDRDGKVRRTSDRYFNVFGLAWRADEVWFTAAGERPLFRNTVYAMNSSGEVRIVDRVPGNTTLHDIAPDGRVLIARTDDRSGVSVRAPNASRESDLSWLDSTNIAAISRDGAKVLIYEYGVGGGARGSTYLRGSDGSPAVRLGDGRALSLSYDSKWAIVQIPESPHVDIIPTGAGQSRRVARAGLTITNAKWLPDGKRIVATVRGADNNVQLGVLDIDGDENAPLRMITTEPVPPSGAWVLSPDGAQLALSTGARVEVYRIAGGASRQIRDMTRTSTVVGWIDRGILLSEDPLNDSTVFVIDPLTDDGRSGPKSSRTIRRGL